MPVEDKKIIKLAIIGGGFSGSALAALFHRHHSSPIEIHLFEKTGKFGAGDAYRTPYPFHLLNVRSKDMSAFVDDAAHFVHWLQGEPTAKALLDDETPIAEQFVPRMLYRQYLNTLVEAIKKDDHSQVTLHLQSAEVISCESDAQKLQLTTDHHHHVAVDKMILAMGNHPPGQFPFPIDESVRILQNPWDYSNVQAIDQHEPVLIIGTGLSMIDAVLSLHAQKHLGKIYALSRHGVMPLPHATHADSDTVTDLPQNLSQLMRHMRGRAKKHMQQGGNWRAVVHALRPHTTPIWHQLSLVDKKRFLRHVAVYWNVHRHRVHDKIAHLLDDLQHHQQLSLLAGRVLAVKQHAARIKLRHTAKETVIPVGTIINCMGPATKVDAVKQPLLAQLLATGLVSRDALNLGLQCTEAGEVIDGQGNKNPHIYALGPLTRGMHWECSAVPEIRQQCDQLVKYILQDTKKY